MSTNHARRWLVRATLVRLALVLALSASFTLAVAPAASAVAPGNAPFHGVWDRTDGPVLEGLVSRTWMWGPEANTGLRWEPYLESGEPGRVTQMFDKSRMEITNPNAVDDGLWYVTNGLLVVELITGRMQIGDDVFLQLDPAQINVAGDADDPTGPTYATFLDLLDLPPAAVGSPVVTRLSRDGSRQQDPALAANGVVVSVVDDVTQHAIAAPFWDFMTSAGLVRAGAGLAVEPLFINAYYATGRPITDPYWATVKIANTYRDALMQCFERRCLTYAPDNPPGWQVEAGNVGQHYDTWRYHSGFEYAIQWINADEGGTVSLPGSGASVTIPPGALSHDTLVTIVPARDTPAPPPGYTSAGDSFVFGLSGATLSGAVEVTLPYDTAPQEQGGASYVVGRHDGNGWQLFAGDVAFSTITVQASQLSTWQAFRTVGDGPRIDLNGDSLPGTSVVTIYAHGGQPVTLAPGLVVSDTSSATVSSATATISNLLDGGAESLSANVAGTGLAANYAAGTLTISGVAPLASYQQALRTVAYANAAGAPDTTPRIITFAFSNGIQTSNTATAAVTIDVLPGNDPPVASDVDLVALSGIQTQITLSASDSERTLLKFEIIDAPKAGTLDTRSPEASCLGSGETVNCTATVTYTSFLGSTDSDLFSYRVSDGQSVSNEAAVKITLTYDMKQETIVTAATGGTVVFPGLVEIVFPPGSLNCDAWVTVKPEPPADDQNLPPASNQVDITLRAVDPDDQSCDNGTVHVVSMVTLGMYYNVTAIPLGKTPENLRVARSFIPGVWTVVETTWLDENEPIIYAEVFEFSKWNVFVG